MSKPKLTQHEFIDELNRRLKQHESYEEGMEFRPNPDVPPGTNLAGISIMSPPYKLGEMAKLHLQAAEEYEVEL